MPRLKHLPLVSAADEIRLRAQTLVGTSMTSTAPSSHIAWMPSQSTVLSDTNRAIQTFPMEIKVNGNVFHAPHNLWLFRHRPKAAGRSQGKNLWDPTSRLWIDALCIDQTDLAERSAQVQLMGTIWRKACGMTVWLGWSDGLEPTVTSTLAKLIADDPVCGRERYADLLLNDPSQQIAVHDEAIFQHVCDFILPLCKKTYWTRRWIVQEILLAQKVLLVCGEQELPWAALCVIFGRYDGHVQRHSESKVPGYDGTDSSSLRTILESTAARIWTRLGHETWLQTRDNLIKSSA